MTTRRYQGAPTPTVSMHAMMPSLEDVRRAFEQGGDALNWLRHNCTTYDDCLRKTGGFDHEPLQAQANEVVVASYPSLRSWRHSGRV